MEDIDNILLPEIDLETDDIIMTIAVNGNFNGLSNSSSSNRFMPFSLLILENILSNSCFFLSKDSFFNK